MARPDEPLRKRRLTAEQRRALKLLARSRHGVDEELLVHSHGFRRPTIVGLVSAGLAVAEREVMKAGAKTIEVVRGQDYGGGAEDERGELRARRTRQ
jgi:hypothetical protein